MRANVELSQKPLGPDRPDFHGTLEQIGEDVARTRQVGANELFFDLWADHPRVDTVDDWLAGMEQLWRVST